MTISSGFFNSVNHDRLYDAEQFGSLFDGIINDGVYEHVGDAFEVTPNSNVNDSVLVGTGRAWFNHTWILNNAQYSITLNPPNLVVPRYDAIVLDIDRRDSVRKNSIVVVEGTPAADPQYPSMVNEELHSQYPIAYIRMNPGNSDIISAENITYNVGNSTCPLVTGPLEVINDDNFFAQMNANFTTFKNDLDEEFTTWFEGIKDLIDDLNLGNINLINSVDNVTIEWPSDTKKLRVKDRGITRNKLSFDLQSIIGVLDPSGWSFQDYYDYVSSLDSSSEEETFTNQYLNSSVISSWTVEQISSFYNILKSNTSKNTLWNSVTWTNQTLSGFKTLVTLFGSSKYSSMIGKKVRLDLGDTYGVHNFIVIGVNHDDAVSGGKALLTFQCEDIVDAYQGTYDVPSDRSFTKTPIFEKLQNMFDLIDPEIQNSIVEVKKEEHYAISGENYRHYKRNYNTKFWIASSTEIGISAYGSGYEVNNLGSLYDYWSSRKGTAKNYIKKYNGTPTGWGTNQDSVTLSYGGTSSYFSMSGLLGVNNNGFHEIHNTTGSYKDIIFCFGSQYIGQPIGSTNTDSTDDGLEIITYYNCMYLVPCFCI